MKTPLITDGCIMAEYRNGPKKWAIICAGIALLGFMMIVYPIISEMDGFNGGFAMIFVGIVVSLTFIISSFVFYVQGRQMDIAISSPDTLAQWTYSKEEWEKYYEIEYERDKKDKRMLFYLASGFSVFFGLAFLIFVKKPAGALYACLGIILLTGFLQWYAPWLTYKRNQKYAGAALISPHGVYLNGMWYPNKRFGRIDSVDFMDNKKTIKFEWSQFAMQGGKVPGRNNFTIRVPVPEGQQKTADNIVAFFNRQ